MKPLMNSFSMFLRQIFKDSMLVAICFAAVLAALFFRFGIPRVERLLCGYFNLEAILADYYLFFDVLLAILVPYMLCFASAMMLLTEYDENLASYLAVTPVGKKGYVVSRLVFPAGLSFAVSVLMLRCFSLTAWTPWMLLSVCLLTSVTSVSLALLIFAFSHNRVEGMATGKLSGLMLLGLPAPFFLHTNLQYIFAPLPSFWIAKLSTEREVLLLLPALLSALVWIYILYKKFDGKLA